MKFLKYFLATVLGAVVSFIIIVLITVSIIGVVSSKKQKDFEVKENSVLVLKLDQPIVDRKPLSPFDFSTMRKNEAIGLNSLLKCIKNAKTDENIKGIYLKLTFVPAGVGTVMEIRSALEDFKESGKFIIAYSDFMNQSAYYLASVSDKIYFNPTGYFNLVGIRAEMFFLKGTFDKLGIEPKIIRYGKFKSAGESYVNDKMSDENREQLGEIINDVWTEIIDDIGASRNISSDRLNEIADSLLTKDPKTLVSLDLVDSLAYASDVEEMIKRKVGVEKDDDMHLVKLAQYDRAHLKKDKKSRKARKNKIAVVYASGVIVSEDDDPNNLSSEVIGKALKKARKDDEVKAVVLRVNSPGGSAVASEVIWNECKLLKKEKPLIVSMGDVAASGGYYISCPADTIVCGASTITGSIGVIGVFFNFEDFFNDKLGVTFDVEKTNEYADFISGTRPMREAEEEYWQHTIDYIYNIFITHVADGRPLNKKEVDEIGQGRVWSGIDAKELGLVDVLGGLNDAIDIAAAKANVGEEYVIAEYPKQKNFFEMIFNDMSEEVKMRAIKKEFGPHADHYLKAKELIEQQGILMRMPNYVNIY